MDSRAFAVLAFLATVGTVPSSYDQRQDGRVNVQIDVKDVQILAFVDPEMLDDYVNYDYPYDYADFTIKPRPTTGKPLGNGTSSVAEETWSVWPTNLPGLSPAVTNLSTNGPPLLSSNSNCTSSQEYAPPSVLVSIEASTQHSGATTGSSVIKETHFNRPGRPTDPAEPRKRCPLGFHLKSGRCFKRRLAFISPRVTAMKLGPALLGKSNVLKINTTASS